MYDLYGTNHNGTKSSPIKWSMRNIQVLKIKQHTSIWPTDQRKSLKGNCGRVEVMKIKT